MTLTMLKLPGPSPHHTENEHLVTGHKQPKHIKGCESPTFIQQTRVTGT